jgi:hypothetical protein
LITTKAELVAYSRPRDIGKYKKEAALIVKTWKEHDQILKATSDDDGPTNAKKAQIRDGDMYTLTIEAPRGNVMARAIQPCLLLVLVGCKLAVKDDKPGNVIAEAKGEAPYFPTDDPPAVIYFDSDPSDEQDAPDNALAGQIQGYESEQQNGDGPAPAPLQADQIDTNLKASMPQTTTSSHESGEFADEEDYESNEEQSAAILHLQRAKLDDMSDWLTAELLSKHLVMTE